MSWVKLPAASIHSSIAATNACFKSLPADNRRASSYAQCKLRTAYQRDSWFFSNRSKTDRRAMREPWRPADQGVHPVVRGAARCMDLLRSESNFRSWPKLIAFTAC